MFAYAALLSQFLDMAPNAQLSMQTPHFMHFDWSMT